MSYGVVEGGGGTFNFSMASDNHSVEACISECGWVISCKCTLLGVGDQRTTPIIWEGGFKLQCGERWLEPFIGGPHLQVWVGC